MSIEGGAKPRLGHVRDVRVGGVKKVVALLRRAPLRASASARGPGVSSFRRALKFVSALVAHV
jgi:hypothetical protein